MRKLINEIEPTQITLSEALSIMYGSKSTVLFAYKSKGNSGWCFLTKISASADFAPRYGFVAMNYTNTHPRFVASTYKDSLLLAMASREVFTFDGIEELALRIITVETK